MPSTNGLSTKRAILYTRVSTKKQAEDDRYSIPQQLAALREYADREGYEVPDGYEVTDPGYSGATLDRPGLDRVRDLVGGGGVYVVLAQDRDRFAREPAHIYLLKREFEEHGAKLRALNDVGDDTPKGELSTGIMDQLAKYERTKFAERSRRGKKRKAREGKVVPPRKVTYGFTLNKTRDGYEINEEEMAVVRRVFHTVADGAGIHAVKRMLEAEGIPTPSGGVRWNRSTLRDMIKRDAYFPHTFDEVASLVSPAVAARLDSSASYGIWWSTRLDVKVMERVRTADGDYADRRTYSLKPKEEWIAVPIPNAGIPREVAERARRNITYNFRQVSKGRRVWELSGGLLHCGECGRKMATNTVAPSGRKKTYHYYLCARKVEENWNICSNKNHKAETLEERVREAVAELFRDPQAIEEQIERRLERERNLTRDPKKEAIMWAKKLTEISAKRSRYQDQQAAGLLTLAELTEKLDHLEAERKTAQRELEVAHDRKGRIETLEYDIAIVLALYGAFAGADLSLFPPEERRRIYATLGLRATAYSSGYVEIEIAWAPDFFPPAEEARELVEHIIYDPERVKWRDEWRARIERVMSQDSTQPRKGGVMS
jgi:site-specific DNA recombinase